MRINEKQINKAVTESLKKVIKEGYDDNPLYGNYSEVIEACGNIIFQNATKGRRFCASEIGELKNDPQFMELKQELMENMEGYFYATRQLLSYVTNKCRENGETFLVEKAERWLNTPFTPKW